MRHDETDFRHNDLENRPLKIRDQRASDVLWSPVGLVWMGAACASKSRTEAVGGMQNGAGSNEYTTFEARVHE